MVRYLPSPMVGLAVGAVAFPIYVWCCSVREFSSSSRAGRGSLPEKSQSPSRPESLPGDSSN